MQILLLLLIAFLLLACIALAIAYRRLARNARHNRAGMLALTDTLPLGIATLNREGLHRYVNQAYADWFGLSRETLPGQDVQVCGQEYYTARVIALLNEDASGQEVETFDISMPNSEPGRRARITLVKFHPISEGSIPTIIAVISDVSANELLEARLQRQLSEMAHVARLATMGELAAKLAHELNQPLAAINGYTRASLRMMRSGQWDATELVDALEDASLQAERAADIIRGLRNFLRKGPAERDALRLPQLVDEVLRLVQHEAREKRVEVSFSAEEELPQVFANRTEIEQVLFNLLLNAIEAMPPPGNKGRRQVSLSATAVAGGVEVTVADSGTGFVEGVAEHLFDPFFSTKKDGMGMGLSICRTIVEAHGSELRASNNPMGGASFRFTLPTSVQPQGEAQHDDV